MTLPSGGGVDGNGNGNGDAGGLQQTPYKKRKLDTGSDKQLQPIASTTTSLFRTTIPAKILKKMKSGLPYKKPEINFSDIGGMEKVLKELCELLLHVKHPEVYQHIGLPPPRGFLLHGPPGCGKTLLAQAIAGVSISRCS